jgi:hypothetical protein
VWRLEAGIPAGSVLYPLAMGTDRPLTPLAAHARSGIRALASAALLVLGLAAWPSPASATIVIDDPGTERKGVALNCGDYVGRIIVNTGVKLTDTVSGTPAPEIEQTIITKFLNAISLSYKGAKCAECCWLQFVWREILGTDASGEGPVTGRMPTTSGPIDLTTDPAKPAYRVDSASRTDPCYTAAGHGTITAEANTMYDQPGPGFPSNMVNNAAITKLRSVAHFDAFLVCAGKVCAKVTWTVSWTRTRNIDGSVTATGPTYEVSDPDITGAKPSAVQMQQLNAQYPGQTLLK